jgi:serine/threonine-protein kinase
VGGFTVERLLGWGACGWVYLARRGDTRFALKLQPLTELGGWARREAHILTRLEHPHVVRFQACGLYPEAAPCWFYLAMEYVEGRTLDVWVREENPGARRVAELLGDMARGLEALHAVGVLHRDLKEVNVIIREATGQAVLLDLGVGTYPGAPPLTEGVLPPGTARYRSPEAHAFQLRHGAWEDARYTATRADDLYALGVILYWMLTDTWPMAAVDTETEVRALLSRTPAAPQVLNPRVPEALSALCLELLAREPEGRPASASAVLARLEAMRAGMDERWDVPLCLEHDEQQAPPAPSVDAERAEEEWLAHGEKPPGPPRRGKKPRPLLVPIPVPVVRASPAEEAALVAGEEVALAPALRDGVPPPKPHEEEPTPREEGAHGFGPHMQGAPAPSMTAPEVKRRWPWNVAGVLGLACLVGAAWWGNGEMARHTRVVESRSAAVSPPVAFILPASVPATAPPEKEAPPVKMRQTPSPEKTQPLKSNRPLARAATVATLTACLGCASTPEVRDLPPLPCPEGAVEAMRKLGISVGDTASAAFDEWGEIPKVMTVRAGRAQLRVALGLGGLKGQTVSGQLYLGERVQGLFTTGFAQDGTPFPICLELFDISGKRGVTRKDASTNPDTARIWPEVRLRAVDRAR